MKKIEKIEAEGYKVKKGYLSFGKPYAPDEKNPYCFYLETPDGELKTVYGVGLDDNFYVGKDKIPATRREIINELYSPTEEEWCKIQYNYSLRTKRYLDEVAKDIGLINYSCGEDEEKIENETTHTEPIFINAQTYLSKVNETYVVQSFVWAVDHEVVYTYTFNRKPDIETVKTAQDLEKCKEYFSLRKISEEFCCLECGRNIHWLDIKGDFRKKYNNLKEKYCGC